MPITVTCTGCGKRLNVRDELVGKKLKCPGCGVTFAATQAAAAHAVKQEAAKKPASAPVAISGGLIALAVSIVAVIAIILICVFGPVAAWKEWEKLGSKPNDDVQEVVTLGLKAYLSQQGMWNPRKPGHDPRTMDDTIFVRDMFVMSMPEAVAFQGSSSEGSFKGKYRPKTGEVDAEVGIGGTSVDGLGAVKEGRKTIHVTGRMTGGKVSAEVDGRDAVVHYPPKEDDDK